MPNGAVKQIRMAAKPAEKPCDWSVDDQEGQRYCEAGPFGHEGGHIGERTRAQYVKLLRAWEATNSTGEGG